jgi:hypothetical protein
MMTMNLPNAIANIEEAEELFAVLDVAFDPAVLAVHRIAILRRFGQEVGILERRQPPLSEDERRPLYTAALKRTYEICARGGSDVEPFLRPRPRIVVPVERLRHSIGKVVVT